MTACFANSDKDGLEYPSARADATVEATPTDAGNKPAITHHDSAMAGDQAMAQPHRAEVPAVPSERSSADAAMTPAPAANDAPTGRIVPCMKSGDKAGRAAGAFVNDAQIAHASLLANTIDSAVAVAAVRRASNPAVREYAEMMIRDHTEANQKEAALLQTLHINPAQNEISDNMLREVGVLTAGMSTDASANVTSTTTTTTMSTAMPASSAAPADARDTLHLSNRFVAAANMQPWTSLLAGVGDSANTTVTSSANVQAARGGAVSGSVTTTKPAAAVTTTTTTTTPAPVATSVFDRKYIDYQVNFHQQVLDGLDSRLIPWASPELRALLEETRPKVVAHLERARELQRTLSSNASN